MVVLWHTGGFTGPSIWPLWFLERRQSLGRKKNASIMLGICTWRERNIFAISYWIKPLSGCIYHFPIDSEANSLPFAVANQAETGKWSLIVVSFNHIPIIFLSYELRLLEFFYNDQKLASLGIIGTLVSSFLKISPQWKHHSNMVPRSLHWEYFQFLSNLMGYDHGDSFSVDFEPNGAFNLKGIGNIVFSV